MTTENRGPAPQDANTDPAANPPADPAQMIQTGFDKLDKRLGEAIDASRGAPPAEPTETPKTPPEPPAETPPAPAVDLAPLKAEFDGVRSAAEQMVENQKKMEATMHEQKEKLIGMEQQLQQRGQAPAIITGRAVPAMFDALTGSDTYKNEFCRGGLGKVENLPSILTEELTAMEQRASTPTTIGATEVGGTVQPYYRPGIVEYPRERLGLWEFMNKMTTDAEKVEVLKESQASAYGDVMNTLEEAIDGDPTPKSTCTVYNAEGFEVGMYVRFILAASTPRKLLTGVNKTTAVLTFATDDLNFDAAIGTKVCVEGVGATAEEGLKPYSYLDAILSEEVLKTLAVLLKTTVQRMKLQPMLLQWMQQRLVKAIKRAYSWQCLYGDDAQAGRLAGFFSETGLQTFVWSTGCVTGDTQVDAIIKAIYTKIVSDGPVGLVMNKQEWANIVLLKGTDGHYISKEYGPVEIVDRGPGQRRIGAYPVELDPTCRYVSGTTSHVLAADFQNAHELWINPNLAAFELGMINDDFEKNIRRARYEECAQNAILSTLSYVQINLDAKPA